MSWKLRTSIFVWGGVGWLYGWLVMVNGSSVGVKSVPRYPTRMALVHVEGLGMYLYIYIYRLFKTEGPQKKVPNMENLDFHQRDLLFWKGRTFYERAVFLSCPFKMYRSFPQPVSTTASAQKMNATEWKGTGLTDQPYLNRNTMLCMC